MSRTTEIRIMKKIDDVDVISICDVFDIVDLDDPDVIAEAQKMYEIEKADAEKRMSENPNLWIGIPALDYCKECIAIKVWCKKNKASYYGAPREDFSMCAAIKVAKTEGNKKIVIEDLS